MFFWQLLGTPQQNIFEHSFPKYSQVQEEKYCNNFVYVYQAILWAECHSLYTLFPCISLHNIFKFINLNFRCWKDRVGNLTWKCRDETRTRVFFTEGRCHCAIQSSVVSMDSIVRNLRNSFLIFLIMEYS